MAIVTFYREACSREASLWTALSDVRAAVPGSQVLRVDDQLVNASDIADGVERTADSIRQLASGTRGAGGFPAPVGIVGRGVKIWRWAEVQTWLAEHGLAPDEATLPIAIVADANAQLARPAHDQPLGAAFSGLLRE
ncbi:hypothetical protein BH23ACT6_BH23ACT6_27740 [soil metagenome]